LFRVNYGLQNLTISDTNFGCCVILLPEEGSGWLILMVGVCLILSVALMKSMIDMVENDELESKILKTVFPSV